MIYLGLGSNLSSRFGDRFKNINLAISYLEESGIKVIKKSSFYETPSYPNKKNPTFINIIISVKTNLTRSRGRGLRSGQLQMGALALGARELSLQI